MFSALLKLRVVFAFLLIFALGGLFAAGSGSPAVSAPLPASVQEFQPTLPTSWGGRSMAVDVNPVDSDVALVATESGGLFRTTDGGDNWTHVDSLVPHRMNDVVWAPNNPNVVIATTWRTADSANPGGIWRSTDGGLTWQRPPSVSAFACGGGNFYGWGISFEPSSNNVYAGTDCGLAVSIDQGATWTLTPLARVHAVVAQPGGIVDVCANDGHHRFTNAAGTLTLVSGPNPIPGAGGGGCPTPNGLASFHDLATDPGDPNVLFAVVGDGSTSTTQCGGSAANPAGFRKLFESDDAGLTWTQVGAACPARAPWVYTNPSRNGNPNDFDIYYSGGLDVYRATCTTNVGGATQRCTGLPALGSPNVSAAHVDPQGMAFRNDSTNCPQYLATDGGIHDTPDCGANFPMAAGSGANGGFNALQIYEVTGQVHPGGHSDYFFGAQDNDNWGSPDSGATWPNSVCCEGWHFEVPRVAPTHGGQSITFVSCGPCNNLVAGAHLTGAAKWSNPPGNRLGADTGAPHLLPPTSSSYVQWTQPLPKPPMGTPPTNQLNLTTDGGTSWTAINGATTTLPLMDHPFVTGPATDPTIYQGVCTTSCGFVAPSGNLLKITGINAATATVTTITGAGTGFGRLGTYNNGQGSFILQAPALGVDRNNPLHLIGADVASNQMMQSRDGGASWTPDPALTSLVTDGGRLGFTVPFVGTQARSIEFSPTDSNVILVGTESSGIIASLDNGQTWARMIGSEQITAASSFFFDEVQDTILVSSYGRGLWTLDLPEADLSLTKTDDPDPVKGGDNLFYTLTATNNGPDPAPDVTVVDTLPSDVSFVKDDLGACTEDPAGTLTCDLGDLGSGESVTLRVRVTVDALKTALTNTATVSSAGAIDPDPDNNTATATTIVKTCKTGDPSTDNRPPTVSDVTIGSTRLEGKPVTFTAVADDNCDLAEDLHYKWTFSDGGIALGQDTSHSFADNGPYTGAVRVTDAAGNEGRFDFSVEITNQDPVVGPLAVPPKPVWGVPVEFSGSATDPSPIDQATLEYRWDFDDGTTALNQKVSHAFDAPGSYDVSLTVTDKDGGSASVSQTVTVNKRDTNIKYEGPISVGPNEPLPGDPNEVELSAVLLDHQGDPVKGRELQFSLRDAGGTVLSPPDAAAETNVTDGNGRARVKIPLAFLNPVSGEVEPLAPGDYVVSVVFKGDDLYLDSEFSKQFTIHVNQPPVVSPLATGIKAPWGVDIEFSGFATDPDGSDPGTLKYVWDFGDGSPTATNQKVSHAFPAPGAYTVTLRVTDKDGAWTEVTTDVTINKRPTTIKNCGETQVEESAHKIPLCARLLVADIDGGDEDLGVKDKTISFTIATTKIVSGETDANGETRPSLNLVLSRGCVPGVISFAGDALYEPFTYEYVHYTVGGGRPGDPAGQVCSLNETSPGFALLDSDGDGCSNGQEAGAEAGLGGLRDRENPWDFFDVPTGVPMQRDKQVFGQDIGAIVARFGSHDDGPGTFDRTSSPLTEPNPVTGDEREDYHPAYDRTPSGPSGWNLGAPDGSVFGQDIALLVLQFGDSCA